VADPQGDRAFDPDDEPCATPAGAPGAAPAEAAVRWFAREDTP
jgi:hypothetical protein